MINRKKVIAIWVISIVFFGFFIATNQASAAIVQCGRSADDKSTPDIDESSPCTICDVVLLGKNTIDFLLQKAAPVVSGFLFLVAGFMILLGGAKPDLINQGKKIFWNTVIGLLIMFSAFLITNTVLKSLVSGTDYADSWFKISCTSPGIGGGGVGPGTIQKYACSGSGKACTADSGGQYTNSNCDYQCPGGPKVSTECKQNFGLSQATGCADTASCVNANDLTTTYDCAQAPVAGQCILSVSAKQQAKTFVDKFNQLAAGSGCSLKLSSTIRATGTGISGCHKAGNSESGTCADFNLLPSDTSCRQYFYQAAKDSGAVVSFLDEYTCPVSSTTGGNIHVNFSSGQAGQAVVPSGGTCVGAAGTPGAQCGGSNIDICNDNTKANCYTNSINYRSAEINSGASGKQICSGIDAVKMIKAIISQESQGNTSATSGKGAYGIMQLKPDTANQYKTGCNVTANIDANWLTDPANVAASVCIATNYFRYLAENGCGCDVKQIAAGYNGGIGACQVSSDCGPNASASGGNCSVCSGQNRPTKKWECLWEDPEHKTCNSALASNYSVTRTYAPAVSYCYKQF